MFLFVASPMTANGARSRSQSAVNIRVFLVQRLIHNVLAIRYTKFPMAHAFSSQRIERKSNLPPRSPSCTIQASHWINHLRPHRRDKENWFSSPNCQQRSITSWQRRSISGFHVEQRQNLNLLLISRCPSRTLRHRLSRCSWRGHLIRSILRQLEFRLLNVLTTNITNTPANIIGL